jgi:hypothetical protein
MLRARRSFFQHLLENVAYAFSSRGRNLSDTSRPRQASASVGAFLSSSCGHDTIREWTATTESFSLRWLSSLPSRCWLIAGAFDAPSQTGWIYNWQTLIGAVVALAAGIAAYLAVRLQIKDTRAQLRAHIAATLGGIKTTTTGEYVGYVIFRNVGRRPAYNFVCPPPRIIAAGEIWEPPEWPGHIPETEKVLPAGTPRSSQTRRPPRTSSRRSKRKRGSRGHFPGTRQPVSQRALLIGR